MHTWYRDKRTARVHTLSWDRADATERALILQAIPSEIGGAMSARWQWRTPLGDVVRVTLVEEPVVSRRGHGTGSITIRLEEALHERQTPQRQGGALYLPALYWSPSVTGGAA